VDVSPSRPPPEAEGTGSVVRSGARPGPPASFSRRALMVGAIGAAVGGTAWWGLRGMDELDPLYRRVRFGAYADNAPYPNLDAFSDLERTVGAHLPTMSWFQDLAVPWLRIEADQAGETGHDLCIALEPADDGRPIPFAEILAGRWDAHLDGFFAAAATYPGRVSLRPFWEMNTPVPTYSVTSDRPTGQVRDVEQFRSTWRYLVDRQRQVGGSTVQWMFCVNGTDVGGVAMEEYWPGASHVDVLGLDTYNDVWTPWTPFDDKVAPMYERLVALAPGRPVVIGETGCREGHGDEPGKASWVREMFLSREFPQLTEVLFFHADRRSDYRLTSSPAALAAYQEFLPLAGGPPDHA
jgi:mannan endo-1,4-beta-mannosidase